MNSRETGRAASFVIQYTKAADKFFRRHEDVKTAYIQALREVMTGEHPERVDLKRIQGKHHVYYRIRIGDWRVVYAVIDGKVIVIQTLLAGSRGDVYKKMDGLK